jgi:hypothetical protein
MNKRTFLKSVLGVIILVAIAVLSPQARARQQDPLDETNWVKIANYTFPVWLAEHKHRQERPKDRKLFLYVEAKDFVPENIRAVSESLAKQYADPESLTITIFSDKEQLKRAINFDSFNFVIDFTDTPAGEKAADDFYSKYAPLPTGYFRARYVREWWGERLEYSPDHDKAETAGIFAKCTRRGLQLASGPMGICSATNVENRR